MKVKSSIALFVLAATALLGAFYPRIDFEEKESMIMHALLSVMEQVHFSPKAMDDQFSTEAFDLYLEAIDPYKRFLTQEEVDQLAVHKLNIDDQAKNRTLEFFDLSVGIIDNADKRAKMLYKSLIDEEFDLSIDETIELDGDKKGYAKNETELKDLWRKYLKYEIVGKVNTKIKEQREKMDSSNDRAEVKVNDKMPSGAGSTSQDLVSVNVKPEKSSATTANRNLKTEEAPLIKTTDELIEEAREEVKEIFSDFFENRARFRRSDRFEIFLNTFTHMNDPHSDYYNPKEKQDFDIRMGGKVEGIGARLSQDKDYIKVVSIVTGGPAWKGKQLEVDDLITAVTQKGSEGVDILGMRVDDVVQMIRGKKGTVVILSVLRKDGTTAEIEIERDIVNIDDAKAKSLILDLYNGVEDQATANEAIENVGYIRLPSFYSEFEGKKGNSCAEDVRKELEKLKAQNVEGVILDLRYNGGGSLRDVITMSGLFIEEGPIVQVKPRGRKPYVYDDEDTSVTWDGPLIVMVNSYSASASEILAAALQDYNRAVIVGSNSTFGKGTVQRFFDLDRAIRGNDEFKPLGQVKLTMQKYYRINGGSTQLRGVVPDIIYPDRFSFVDVGEKEYDFPMEWSEISPVEYNQNVLQVPDLSNIRAESNKRVMANETLTLINENAQRLKQIRDVSEFPLNLDKYARMMEEREAEADKYTDLMKNKLDRMAAKNLEEDMPIIQADSVKIAKNDEFMEMIGKDVYLEETMKVMKDLVKEI